MEITGAHIFYEIPIFGGIKITETLVNSLFVILLIFIICKILTSNLKVVPTSKRQIVAEWIVEKCRGLVLENMGEKYMDFVPFIMAILGLVGLSNLLGLLGMYPPTAEVNVPIGWAIVVFILITREKMKPGFGKYLKGFTEPFFLFTPLNLISEVALPISMGFRLFGNVLSGVVISELLLWALGNFSVAVLSSFGEIIPLFQVGVPAVFSLYFDIFSGCLQAFVFSMLTMLNISLAGADE